MKNDRKPSNRHHQKIPFSIDEFLDEIIQLGADINIGSSAEITIPREEYDRLKYQDALLDILHRVYKTRGKYTMSELLETFFKESNETADATDGKEEE